MEANAPDELRSAVSSALAKKTLTTIVSKGEALAPASFHMDLTLLENRFQFSRALKAMGGGNPG